MTTAVDNVRGCLDAETLTLAAVPNAVGSALRLVEHATSGWGLAQECTEAALAVTRDLVRAAVSAVAGRDVSRQVAGGLLDMYKRAQATIGVRVIWHTEHVLVEVCAPVVQPPGEDFLRALPEPRSSYPHRDATGRICAQTVWCGIETGWTAAR
jgi:hypothetical protein